MLANHEGRRLPGCPEYPSGYCPAAYMDNIRVWNYAKTDFSDRFIENPVDSCSLDVDLAYTNNTLGMEFEIGSTNAARWRVFLVRYGVKKILVTDRKIIDPPVSLTVSIPEIQSQGTIGILTTLTTGEDVIICSDFETVDTGQPEDVSVLEYPTPTVEVLGRLFEEKLNETMLQLNENMQNGNE